MGAESSPKLPTVEQLRRAQLAEAERQAAPPPAPVWPEEILEAARLLGARPAEVRRVYEADEGLVIETTTGLPMVVVPEDRPDPLGRTGLMLLSPTRSPNTNRSNVIYGYVEPDPADEPEPEPPAPVWVPPWRDPDTAAAWAAEHEGES